MDGLFEECWRRVKKGANHEGNVREEEEEEGLQSGDEERSEERSDEQKIVSI